MANKKPANPVVDGLKKCTRCDLIKAEDMFFIKRGKPRAQCKMCQSDEYKKRYLKDKEVYDARIKKWQKNNPEKTKSIMLKSLYDIDLTQWNDLLNKQNSRCAICKEENKSKKNFHTDHNHKTGLVRGLLCNNCNAGLGHFKDNTDSLLFAVDYLNKGIPSFATYISKLIPLN